MVRASWKAVVCLAIILLFAAPGAVAYRECYLGACVDYDYGASVYAEAQVLFVIAGGGSYAGPEYRGYTVHVFSPGTYVSVYDGAWYGDEFTLISVGVAGKEYVRYYQDDRTTGHPGGYHCFSVSTAYSRCGTGLP